MSFPRTFEEYKQLEAEGKTVVYHETRDEVPPGDGWELWSWRKFPGEPAKDRVIWRRVMSLDEAAEWEAAREGV